MDASNMNEARPLRPLLPNTVKAADEGGSPPDSSGPSEAPKRRTTIIAACSACRKRKAKCSGDRPCTLCARRDSECVYDTEDPTETHMQALKRKLEDAQEQLEDAATEIQELKEQLSAFEARETKTEKLFDCIKTRPDPEVQGIVNMIRRPESDVERVIQEIEHGDILLGLGKR